MKVSTSWGLTLALAFSIAGPSFAAPADPADPAAPATAETTAPPDLGEGIVATVNGQPIYQKDIEQQLWASNGEQFTDRAVNELIVRLEAEKRGVTATAEETQAEYDTQKERFTTMGRTEEDWQQIENRYGKENLLKSMEITVLANKIGEIEAEKITLSEEEKQQIIEETEREAHQVHAQHILVGTGVRFNNRSDEDAQARVKEAEEKLADGAEWAVIAREYSDDLSNKDNSGDLGLFPRGTMVKPFEDAVFSMEAGKITENAVKTDFGYHIIKVVEVQKETVSEEDKNKAVEDALTARRQQARTADAWFAEARASYTILTRMPWE